MSTNAPRRLSLVLALLLVIPASHAKTPVASGTGGAVATISEQATQAGLAILNQGGNAVDAAVAAAATLGVTDPFSCGIGGGGFMMIYLAKEKRVVSIDHRETAPASFSPATFRHNGKELDFDATVESGASVGVPGTVRGWHEALNRYGSMSFKQVLAPAIGVAGAGFPVSATFNQLITENKRKLLASAGASALFLQQGKALPVGSLLKNPGMARAYRDIAAGGQKAFYAGPMARAIVAAAKARGGALTLADLANYEARIRLPVRSTYRGYELYGMGLPSSAGVTVAEALNILEAYDLKALPRANAEHLYLEASRLAFADRGAYLADPEFVEAPLAGLLSKEYATKRRAQISAQNAAGVVAAGDPYPFQDDASVPLRPPPRQSAESAHTAHLTVSDKDGNIVSYTFTIESWGGSGIVVPGYGFLLNNEMTDFDFSGPHPNVVEAGKRPRSSMAPTIALKDGKPAFALGSPGGGTIITTVLQTIINHVDFGMPMERALNAPRLSQRNGDVTWVEPNFIGSAQARGLEKLGHKWATRSAEPSPNASPYNPDGTLGAASAIVFHPDGSVTAVSEGARDGVGSALVQQRRR